MACGQAVDLAKFRGVFGDMKAAYFTEAITATGVRLWRLLV